MLVKHAVKAAAIAVFNTVIYGAFADLTFIQVFAYTYLQVMGIMLAWLVSTFYGDK